MSADEKTTWGEVCQRVSYQDSLYPTCRQKVEGFTGFSAFDETIEDFDESLLESAQPIPTAPERRRRPAKKPAKKNDAGAMLTALLEGFMTGDLGKYAIYGGVAAAGLAWWLWLRPKSQITVSETPTTQKGLPGQTPTLAAVRAA